MTRSVKLPPGRNITAHCVSQLRDAARRTTQEHGSNTRFIAIASKGQGGLHVWM